MKSKPDDPSCFEKSYVYESQLEGLELERTNSGPVKTGRVRLKETYSEGGCRLLKT